jgi:hypothetical protein
MSPKNSGKKFSDKSIQCTLIGRKVSKIGGYRVNEFDFVYLIFKCSVD